MMHEHFAKKAHSNLQLAVFPPRASALLLVTTELKKLNRNQPSMLSFCYQQSAAL
jgi:hypothetical protein